MTLKMARRAAKERAMRIEVQREAGTRYRSTLHRADGAVVALEGGSWNRIGGPVGRVPHDLAHLVVEHELGLARGLWGVLAAGGLVQNASLVGGRRPPHALARSRAVTGAAAEDLRQAEVLVRVVADATLDGVRADLPALERTVGSRWWTAALTRAALERMRAGLTETAVTWDRLAVGAALVRTWPVRSAGER
jgi:hypothetical protein